MSAEDRLRELLQSEATTIVPAGDGLARIRDRVARRRRTRLWLVPSAAVATAGAAAAFFLLAPDDDRTATLQPGETPSSSATAEPTASPVPVVPDDGGMPLTGPAIWPFTSQQQAASWQTRYPYADNGLDVGRHFVADHLGLTGVEVSQPCVSCDTLALKVGGKAVGEVTLARIGVGFASGHGTHVFSVTAVGGTDLTVTSPKPGAAITSPTHVTGRITGVHENVMLRLLSSSGDELATAGAPAGQEAPWSGTLSWTRTDWTTGSVVGVTRSDKDGAVTRVVALPVTRATGATTSAFVGLVDGHVSLYDSTTGERLRQLTYPPAGKEDRYARWSSGVLVWIRSAAAGCGAELDRLEGGSASTLTKSTSLQYGSAALSPSSGWVAWTEIPCTGSSAGEVVVSGGGAPPRRLSIPTGTDLELYDVTDDGALLVRTNDKQASGPGTIGVVPAGALSLDGTKALSVAPGCFLASGATFLGTAPAAFESCGEKVRLVRFTPTGARAGTDPSFTGEPPTGTSSRGSALLVWLFGGDSVGSVATYADGAFHTLVPNDGCASNTDLKGCVTAPDW